MADDKQTFSDTLPQAGSNDDQYRDPTNIDPNNAIKADISPSEVDGKAEILATWIRTKQWGRDVRESLALFVEWISSKFNGIKNAFSKVQDSQTSLEGRQTDVEKQLNTFVASSTDKDNLEVIQARSSSTYGDFPTLDARLEALEKSVATVVPNGFTVDIEHGLSRNPTVTADYYEYAIDTEPNGFDTGPAGTFGGTAPKHLAVTTKYPDANTVQVTMPVGYKLNGAIFQGVDGNWYLIEGYKTIRFVLG